MRGGGVADSPAHGLFLGAFLCCATDLKGEIMDCSRFRTFRWTDAPSAMAWTAAEPAPGLRLSVTMRVAGLRSFRGFRLVDVTRTTGPRPVLAVEIAARLVP